jgi:hypothetical protein
MAGPFLAVHTKEGKKKTSRLSKTPMRDVAFSFFLPVK